MLEAVVVEPARGGMGTRESLQGKRKGEKKMRLGRRVREKGRGEHALLRARHIGPAGAVLHPGWNGRWRARGGGWGRHCVLCA